MSQLSNGVVKRVIKNCPYFNLDEMNEIHTDGMEWEGRDRIVLHILIYYMSLHTHTYITYVFAGQVGH